MLSPNPSFETSAPDDTKITLNATRTKGLLIWFTSLFRSTDGSRFWVNGQFQICTQSDAKLPLKSQCLRHVIYVALAPAELKFHFHPKPCCFGDAGHFEKSEPNDLKMILNTKRSKVPHMLSRSSRSSKRQSVSLYSQPFFELQTILKQLYQIILKWSWNLQGQKYPIYALQVQPTPKFQSVSLKNYLLSSARLCRDSCTEWPQNDLGQYEDKGTWYMFYKYPGCQISICFALQPAVFELDVILRKLQQMTLKWPWTLQV